MKPVPPMKLTVRVSELLRARLRETGHSSRELADAAEVPAAYIDELLTGRRRPPLPSRTDVYEKMTRFLRLGRNDLAACATAERAGTAAADGCLPDVAIRRLLLGLCEPDTARELEGLPRRGDRELLGLIERLLGIVQGAARRALDDQVGLRLSAARHGTTYAALRLRVLEFLDATPGTLTAQDVTDFMQPRIAQWGANLETGVLRVVLKAQDAPDRDRRRPAVRTAT